MNMMIAITIRPGATTAAVRVMVFGNAWPIMPPPAATSTRKKVPYSSENRRRHSWFGSWKSAIAWRNCSSFSAKKVGNWTRTGSDPFVSGVDMSLSSRSVTVAASGASRGK